MKDVIIHRDLFFDKQASLGTCYVYDGRTQLFKKESLERGWVDNQNRISCVPVGIYDLVLEYSDRFEKMLWEIKGVQDRSECKFHSMNYWWQSNGCVGLGNNRKFLDNDPIMDITSSRDTMKLFHKAMGNDTRARLDVRDIFQ